MTEGNPEAPAQAVDPVLTGYAVYDEAELRFVGEAQHVTEAEAKTEADRLNKTDAAKAGRADGERGKRYTVRPI